MIEFLFVYDILFQGIHNYIYINLMSTFVIIEININSLSFVKLLNIGYNKVHLFLNHITKV
jgi:hypothetical protein